MPYVLVEDFRAGLDARRKPVAGVPGSLTRLVNGHITRGGDIERRKAFVPMHDLPAGRTFGLQASGGALTVFGSDAAVALPPAIRYQRLQHPHGRAMTKLLAAELFDGRIYAIAGYDDGSVHHFHDGKRVQDWGAGIVTSLMGSAAGIAQHLASVINGRHGFLATASGAVVTITGPVGLEFPASATAVNGGVVDNQAIAAVTQANAGTPANEVLARGSFTIVAGTTSGTAAVAGVTVDGVEILGAPVSWAVSHSQTAQAVAQQINTFTSSPDYTAFSTGARVTIVARPGSGSGINGAVVAAVGSGDAGFASVTNMSGGVTATAGGAQVTMLTISGTFEPGDRFSVTLGDHHFGADGGPQPVGRTALTFRSKVYSAAGSLLHFCGLNAPNEWNRLNDAAPGAGFVNLASQDSGAEELVAAEVYQNSLAVFSRNAIQILLADEDDARNQVLQPIKNSGTRAPRSVISHGSADVFYLSDTGIRSLRARDSSNAAFVSDVGTAIDPLVRADLERLAPDVVAAATAVLEPVDGRYWLALGERAYVFSYFPGAKVSAWSTYELGFPADAFAVLGDRVWVRSRDRLLLYGGPAGDAFPTAGSAPLEVMLPFMTAGRPASHKVLTGMDAALEGIWRVEVLTDPRNEARRVQVGTLTATTYMGARIPLSGRTTHFAPRLTADADGPASLSNLCIHYELEEAG
jgi:hypothetical protein